MSSSKAMRVFTFSWAVITVVETIRALQDPDTREFFAVSIVVLAVPLAIGSVVALVIRATRPRQDRLSIKT